jgi:hypothetical protein
MHRISLEKNISFDSGTPLCIKESFEDNTFYIGTMGGKILQYDLRFNSILNEFSYYNNDPIMGISTYLNNKLNLGEIFQGNNNDIYNGKYLIIWTASNTHEVGFWNSNTNNCDILLKVNNVNLTKETKDKNIFLMDVDYPLPLTNLLFNKYSRAKRNDISINYINLNKYDYIPNINYLKFLSMKHAYDDFYINQYPTLKNIYNINNNRNTVQCISLPTCDNFNINTNISYLNTSYIITSGNDSIIRYWDISKEGINNINGNNLNDKGSYIINAPNYLTYCKFSKSSFSDFVVLQSNESLDDLGKRTNILGFSEYQNYNGITYHSSPQNEFEANCQGDLKYCTKISEPSHKGVINDLLCYGLNSDDGFCNILASCSNDGSIKIWK